MKFAATSRGSDRIALVFLLASMAILIFVYGFTVAQYRIFPYSLFQSASSGFQELKTQFIRTGVKPAQLPWYYRRVEPVQGEAGPVRQTGDAYPGLNLVTRVGERLELSAEILDMEGRPVHRWDIDWFKIWPDAEHVPEWRRPQNQPGTHIHGAVVTDDGNLIMNFEHLGLACLAPQGEAVWRLPYCTHHSIHVHDDGNLWVCGQKTHTEPSQRFPNRMPPFEEYTLLEVTPEGTILEDWSVAEILRENHLDGLLHLGSLHNFTTQVGRQDLLHLNDVEPFPKSMEEDFFRHGDIMVSLRNINTVFVFNRNTRKIRFICTGWFVRQHDPDFIDGNRFSVYDNNNIGTEANGHQSRIVIVSAREQTREVYFEGHQGAPFYSAIMGKHQWLPNGNLLISESFKGKAFELNPQGEVVWEYANYVDHGVVGIVEEVQRLPASYGPFSADEQTGRTPVRHHPPESDELLATDTHQGRVM